jgi:N-6 DNA Methylase
MPDFDKIRDLEWLGHVQPVGLVVSPRVLAELGLAPAYQTPADTEQAAVLLGPEDGPALPDAWAFLRDILGWPADRVAGAPGGPPIEDGLRIDLAESATVLEPHWAVAKPGGGWQLLVRIEAAGIEPEKRGALSGWEATPHQRFERLLRETGVQTGLLITDAELRLIHAPRGETSGWLGFPLRPLGTVSGRPMLGGLKLLLNRRRLFTDAENARLPALLAESRRAQATVSTQLATQVLGALHELLRGLHAAEPERIAGLAQTQSQHLYEGLLTVLLRLVFLLYAEDRDLIPSRADRAARDFYDQGYGVRRLHSRLLEDAARFPDTMDERRGAWGGLLALFRLVHTGDGTNWIRGRGGKLFDPAAFLFLQGQTTPGDPPRVPPMSDGAVLRILDLLLTLDGERLSYRTLDVEQIGSVYETVMGFTVTAMPGPALAIKAGRNNRTPVFVDLADLLRKRGADRLKSLKEDANRSGTLSARQAQPVTAATTEAALGAALAPLVDERGSPRAQVWPAGTPLLQPTDERRRTGSHYTPRELTNPIVEHALAPAFARLGDDATPEQVLSLKVCDPAMGSGAFLVEACRQIAALLVRAWTRHPGTRPEIAADEDEDLLARRLVAQRCLYGVDKNPMAVDLARLSLWLATLARDHEFTFVDHALKTGDSLVGLTARQIGALTWGDDRQGSLFGRFVAERVNKVVRGRAAIRDAPDDVQRAMQEATHAIVETTMADLRSLGDAILACFFAEAKPRERQEALHALQDLGGGDNEAMWTKVRQLAGTLAKEPHAIFPFHWEIEFPEVFAGPIGGFDAIVGNPPFLGGKRILSANRAHYSSWLQTLHDGADGNADLVAHFFRRAFSLLRGGGCLGLIATNTIGQGDTRESGLQPILTAGGAITHATRRLPWPGEAAVVVSVVHIRRGSTSIPMLDGKPVRRISAYLVEGDLDTSPVPLSANNGKAFQGMILLGMGFTFDDMAAVKGKASPISEMHRLIAKDKRNAERIFPYLGGEEVNTDPRHGHRRWCIDFDDFPLKREVMDKPWAAMDENERRDCRRIGIVPLDYQDAVADDWPDLLAVLEERVKSEVANQTSFAVNRRWWQFWNPRPALRQAVVGLEQVHVLSRVSAHHAVTSIPAGVISAETTIVFASDRPSLRGVLQSRPHELWAAFFASSLKSDVRYGPSDCFDTFPFPETLDDNVCLAASAITYHESRATLMSDRNEGLTRIYNRFHDPAERGADVVRLRELHHALDSAVLFAYGWNDLADRASSTFLTPDTEPDYRYQGRFFWAGPFRDEVLTRLLDLNRARADEERRLGIWSRRDKAHVDESGWGTEETQVA